MEYQITCPHCGTIHRYKLFETYPGSGTYKCPACNQEFPKAAEGGAAQPMGAVQPMMQAPSYSPPSLSMPRPRIKPRTQGSGCGIIVAALLVVVITGVAVFVVTSGKKVKEFIEQAVQKATGNQCKVAQVVDVDIGGTPRDIASQLKGCIGENPSNDDSHTYVFLDDPNIQHLFFRKDTAFDRVSEVLIYFKTETYTSELRNRMSRLLGISFKMSTDYSTWENNWETLDVGIYKNYISIRMRENTYLIDKEGYMVRTREVFKAWWKLLGLLLMGKEVPLTAAQRENLLGKRYGIQDVLQVPWAQLRLDALLQTAREKLPDARFESFTNGSITVLLDHVAVDRLKFEVPNQTDALVESIYLYSKTGAVSRIVPALDCAFGMHQQKIKDAIRKEYDMEWKGDQGINVYRYDDYVKLYTWGDARQRPDLLIGKTVTLLDCFNNPTPVEKTDETVRKPNLVSIVSSPLNVIIEQIKIPPQSADRMKPSVVLQAMKNNGSTILTCRDTYLKGRVGQHTVRVNLAIEKTGKVSGVKILGDVDKPFSTCIKKALSKIQFPTFSGPAIRLTSQLIFF